MPTKLRREVIDDSFLFVCSLYPNDYVVYHFSSNDTKKIFDGNGKLVRTGSRRRLSENDYIDEGYYVKYAISGGNMTFINQTSSGKDADSLIAVSGRPAFNIERIDINILGDNYPWE